MADSTARRPPSSREARGESSPPVLSIVVPCHDEEENVDVLVQRLEEALSPLELPWEVVFVDDGSRDGTLERLRRLTRSRPEVRYVALTRNFGHEAATTAGLEHAKGDAVVLMDADLQDPPEIIPDMVGLWRQGFHVVYARRTARDGENVLKRWTSRLFYRMMARITAFDLPADVGDFRLMSRSAVNAFLRMPERNRFVRGMVAWSGFRSAAVTFRRSSRHGGVTKYSWWRLTVLALDAMTSFSAAPLHLVSVAGLVVTGLSLLGAATVVFQKLFLGIPIPGYAFLVTGVFFLGGVQILMLGMIGEYVGRIFVDTQRRPVYFVAERGAFGEPSEEAGGADILPHDRAAGNPGGSA